MNEAYLSTYLTKPIATQPSSIIQPMSQVQNIPGIPNLIYIWSTPTQFDLKEREVHDCVVHYESDWAALASGMTVLLLVPLQHHGRVAAVAHYQRAGRRSQEGVDEGRPLEQH